MDRNTLHGVALIAFVGLATAASVAMAQGPGGGGMGPCGGMGSGAMMLDWFDDDGDGKVTLQEFQAGHAERFAAMDANSDGKVTPDEFQAPPKPPAQTRVQRMFRRMDANGDGVITQDEFEKRSEAQFERFDLNGDKVITVDEIQHRMALGRNTSRRN